MTDLIEKLASGYWDAFRNGFLSVGGDRNYPTWAESNDPVKVETMRCLRQALEGIRDEWDSKTFDQAFPDSPLRRRDIPETATEARLIRTLGKKPLGKPKK